MPATLTRHVHVRYVGVSNWAVWQIVKALCIAEQLGLSRFDLCRRTTRWQGGIWNASIVPMLPSEGLGLIEPVPIQWTPRSTMSVIHGRLVRALATNREPAVGG